MCIYVQCVQKPTKSANRKQESDGSKNATHNMVYLYDASDQISDFCHQQLLRKMRRKISWTDGRMDRGKTVYPPPPSGSGGIKNRKSIYIYLLCFGATFSNISAISWRPVLVLVMEEARVPGENHRPWASNWQTLSLANQRVQCTLFCNLQSWVRTHAVLVI